MSQVIALVDDDRNILTSVDRAPGGGLRHARLFGRRGGAESLRRQPARPGRLRHQDADGRDGAASAEVREMGGPVGAVPVIFLTSKDDELDEALELAMGADDYIAKPFSQRLLIARIRAILRRQDLERGQANSADHQPEEELSFAAG